MTGRQRFITFQASCRAAKVKAKSRVRLIKVGTVIGVAIGIRLKIDTANLCASSNFILNCKTAHAQIGKPHPFLALLAEMREIYIVMEGGMRVSVR